MNYTNATLLLLGFIGILLHNLIALNKLNKKNKGNYSLIKYIKMESYTIAISAICVCLALICKTEIVQLEVAGKWLGFAFVTIGYTGQSIVIFLIGKATSIIKDKRNEDLPPSV